MQRLPFLLIPLSLILCSCGSGQQEAASATQEDAVQAAVSDAGAAGVEAGRPSRVEQTDHFFGTEQRHVMTFSQRGELTAWNGQRAARLRIHRDKQQRPVLIETDVTASGRYNARNLPEGAMNSYQCLALYYKGEALLPESISHTDAQGASLLQDFLQQGKDAPCRLRLTRSTAERDDTATCSVTTLRTDQQGNWTERSLRPLYPPHRGETWTQTRLIEYYN